ncbi:MAG: DUF6140 family protein [Bacteroidales bacterium]
MALYRITVKQKRIINRVIIEPGMQVEVPFMGHLVPVSGPCGDAINAAFMRVYGIDLKKMNALNSTCLQVQKIG